MHGAEGALQSQRALIQPEGIDAQSPKVRLAIRVAQRVEAAAGVGAHPIGPVVANFWPQAEVVVGPPVKADRCFPIIGAVECGNRLTLGIQLVQIRAIDAYTLRIGKPLQAYPGGPMIVEVVKQIVHQAVPLGVPRSRHLGRFRIESEIGLKNVGPIFSDHLLPDKTLIKNIPVVHSSRATTDPARVDHRAIAPIARAGRPHDACPLVSTFILDAAKKGTRAVCTELEALVPSVCPASK